MSDYDGANPTYNNAVGWAKRSVPNIHPGVGYVAIAPLPNLPVCQLTPHSSLLTPYSLLLTPYLSFNLSVVSVAILQGIKKRRP